MLVDSCLRDIPDIASTVTWQPNPEKAMVELQSGSFNLCFVDYSLGATNGLEFIQQAASAGVGMPMILLTGADHPEIEAAAAASGAVDFVAKYDLSPPTLARAIRFAVAGQKEAEELKRKTTELETAVEALANERSLLQQAMDHTKHGIAMFDEKQRLITSNARYLEIYGFSPDVVRPGTDLTAILRYSISLGNYSQEEGRRLLKERSRQAASTRPSTYQQRLSDGRTISVDHAPISGGGSVTTCEDITETLKKQQESAALASSAALADAVLASKSRFLSNMSHELRTPLNAIIGFNDIFRQQIFGPIGSKQYEAYAEDIGRSAAALLQTIDQLLDMSLLYSDQTALDEHEFELSDALQHAVRLHEGAIEEKGITLKTNLAAGFSFYGDENKITHAVDCLLDNAIKFSYPASKICVNLATTKDSGALIEISDAGPGIPADQISDLLTPFEQAEAADCRSNHGSGLGLPIASGLIRLHGGALDISSAEEGGTTVQILLPPDRISFAARAAVGRRK